MYCNKSVHYALNEDFYIKCPFCYKQIQIYHSKKYKCCLSMDVHHLNNSFVCLNCGSIHRYEVSVPYIYFYEKRHLIKRKSIYNRKYHLQNIIRRLTSDIQISHNIQQKILDIFAAMDKVLPIVNNNSRK